MAAHRYWRIKVTGNWPGYFDGYNYAIKISAIELLTAMFAGAVVGSGTASASTEGGGDAAWGFDQNDGGNWWAPTLGAPLPHWLQYDLGSGNEADIVQIAVGWSSDGNAIGAFSLQQSDDGIAWEDRYLSGGETSAQYFTLSAEGTPNQLPIITSNGGGATAVINVAENTNAVVTTVTATDADNDTITFSIGGTDDLQFTIDPNSGELNFVALPDYENPTDSNQINEYHIDVIAHDGTTQDTQSLTINVLDIELPFTNDGGGNAVSVNVAENTTAVTTVQSTGATAYAVTGGTDSSLFQINGSTGALDFIDAPDYENPSDADTNNVYQVIVSATLNAETVYQTLTITVTDVAAGVDGEPHLSTLWTPVITLNSVDVSAQITGVIQVEAEESTSRVASFVLRPQAGTINASDWLGVTVSIDYKTVNSAGSTIAQSRLFTGTVDQAVYDPITRLTSFDCTDDMQGKFEAMTQAAIDAVITDARWSDSVFGDYKDGWLYFENLLSTHPQAYDYNVDGVTGTLADWAAKVTPDFSYDSSSIIEDSISYSVAPKRELFNKYIIDYSYRFSRLLHRAHAFVWTGFVFSAYFAKSHELPTKEMITNAAQSAGWGVSSTIEFQQLPTSASVAGWVISEEYRDILATRAAWNAVKRWSQDVTENYSMTIQAPQSVAWLGEVAFEEHASNQTELNVDGWADGIDTPSGRENSIGDIVQDKFNRTVSRNDLETLIARARTEILGSHRTNFVQADILLNPLLERFHTVRLDSNGIVGQGKVVSIIHSMDIDAGEAITKSRIAISLNGGAASGGDSIIGYPSEPNTDPITTPPASSSALDTNIGGDDSVPNYDENWDGFTGNFSSLYGLPTPEQIYPRRFRVVTPDINQDSVDHVEGVSNQTYDFDIPDETLTITVI